MCELLKAAASTAPEHYGAFFTGSGSPPEGLPVRAGYYAGYLVAADLGRTRSLVELASLSASDAAPLVLESLKRLGDCE